MIRTQPGALVDDATLEGAPAGLTLTARLVDGDETLPTVVTVTAKLDDEGDALDAYTASFTAPDALPVMLEWLQGAVVVGQELVTSPAEVTTDITTLIGQFRLLLGDTTEPVEFSDSEIQWFLDEADDDVEAAVLAAINVLVLRYSRIYDVTVDGQSFKRSQIALAYARRAGELAGAGRDTVTSLFVTRMDAYSDDVRSDDTRAPSVLNGYDLDEDHDIPA